MELLWIGMALAVLVLGIRAWLRLRSVRHEAREAVQADVASLEAMDRFERRMRRPIPRHRLPPAPDDTGEGC